MDISCCIESIQKLLTIQGQDFYSIFLLAIKAETGEFWPYIMWAEIFGGKKSKSHGPPLLLV